MEASCMTDLASAATCLSNIKCAARDTVMAHFYEKHAKGNDLILCKWLAISASACTDDALVCVTENVCVCVCVCVQWQQLYVALMTRYFLFYLYALMML